MKSTKKSFLYVNILIFVSLLTSGCSEKNTKVNVQCFIVTQSANNIKLGLVSVFAQEEESFNKEIESIKNNKEHDIFLLKERLSNKKSDLKKSIAEYDKIFELQKNAVDEKKAKEKALFVQEREKLLANSEAFVRKEIEDYNNRILEIIKNKCITLIERCSDYYKKLNEEWVERLNQEVKGLSGDPRKAMIDNMIATLEKEKGSTNVLASIISIMITDTDNEQDLYKQLNNIQPSEKAELFFKKCISLNCSELKVAYYDYVRSLHSPPDNLSAIDPDFNTPYRADEIFGECCDLNRKIKYDLNNNLYELIDKLENHKKSLAVKYVSDPIIYPEYAPPKDDFSEDILLSLQKLNDSKYLLRYLFNNLRKTTISAKTDADGKCSFELSKNKKWVIFATAERSVGDKKELYYWINKVKSDGEAHQVDLLLSNDNILTNASSPID